MEFTQQSANQNTIISLDNVSVSLASSKLKTPCFISSNQTEELSITKIEDINKEFLFPLLAKESLDILIIGTGESTVFLMPKQQVELSELGLGIECMNNTSASSSFNLLLADLRKVGLLII